jgi:hypothetical protein
MVLHSSLAFQMAVFLIWNSVPPTPAVLGVVTGANRAHLNNTAVSEGTTVYDGDRCSTEGGGMMLLHGEAVSLDLAEESAVLVRSRVNGEQSMQAEMSRGTLVFRASRAAALEIAVLEALIRPANDVPTIARVTVAGSKELRIYARRGSLQFSYRGDTQTIAEGESYRVILDPPEDATQTKEAVKNRRRRVFLLVAIGGGGAGVATFLLENRRHKDVESPDHP